MKLLPSERSKKKLRWKKREIWQITTINISINISRTKTHNIPFTLLLQNVLRQIPFVHWFAYFFASVFVFILFYDRMTKKKINLACASTGRILSELCECRQDQGILMYAKTTFNWVYRWTRTKNIARISQINACDVRGRDRVSSFFVIRVSFSFYFYCS